MEKKKHLPFMGVGPLYIAIIIILTILGINLSKMKVFENGTIAVLRIPFALLGAILILAGCIFWISALFQSKLDYNIKNNILVTSGVYAYVRNPIYSAAMMICTGVLLIQNNIYLLVLPIVYWIFMTLLMKHTEEKWLTKLYGQQYLSYCKHVNRCIPWIKR